MKLSDAKIGDQVRIGLTTVGGLSASSTPGGKSIVGIVVGRRQQTVGHNTYVAWEEPNPDFTAISLNDQCILPERRTEYSFDAKFKYGRHFDGNYEVEVLNAKTTDMAAPPPVPIKTMKLSEAKVGDQVRVGLSNYGGFAWNVRPEVKTMVVSVAGHRQNASTQTYVIWEEPNPDFNGRYLLSDQYILPERRTEYGFDEKFKCGRYTNQDIEVELVKAAEVKPEKKVEVETMKLNMTATGDKVKVPITPEGYIGLTFNSGKSIEAIAIETPRGERYLVWEEQPACKQAHRIPDFDRGRFKIEPRYIYGAHVVGGVDIEMIQAAAPIAPEVKPMKLNEATNGDKVKVPLDGRGYIQLCFAGTSRSTEATVLETINGDRYLVWEGKPADCASARLIEEGDRKTYKIDARYTYGIEIYGGIEIKMIQAAPAIAAEEIKPEAIKKEEPIQEAPKLTKLGEIKAGEWIRFGIKNDGSFAEDFGSADQFIEAMAIGKWTGFNAYVGWEEPSQEIKEQYGISRLAINPSPRRTYEIEDRYKYGLNLLHRTMVEKIEAPGKKPEALIAEAQKEEVKQEIVEIVQAIKQDTCECGHCGKKLSKDKIYTGDNKDFTLVWCKDCINEEREGVLRRMGVRTSDEYEENGWMGETWSTGCIEKIRSFSKKGQTPEVVETSPSPAPPPLLFIDAKLKVGDVIKIGLTGGAYNGIAMDRSSGKTITATVMYVNGSDTAYVAWDKKSREMISSGSDIWEEHRSRYKINKRWKYGTTLNPNVQIEVVKRAKVKKTAPSLDAGFLLACAAAGIALTGLSSSTNTKPAKERSNEAIGS